MDKPRVLESDVQSKICYWLLDRGYFFWRCNVAPMYGRSRFLPKGLPDIAVVCEGHFYGFEVKRPARPAPLTADQVSVHSQIRDNGGFCFVVHSLEDVEKVLPLRNSTPKKTIPPAM